MRVSDMSDRYTFTQSRVGEADGQNVIHSHKLADSRCVYYKPQYVE